MSKSINFYATQRDLAQALSIVESETPIKYVAAGIFDNRDVPEFMSHNDITHLGIASAGDQSHNPRFLVLNESNKIVLRPIQQKQGGVRFAVDQLLNPNSIALMPGGVYGDSCVIAGQAGTCTDDSESQALVNTFAKSIRRQFVRIQSYYVGSEAKQLMDKGYRLTSDARRSSEYDLSCRSRKFNPRK